MTLLLGLAVLSRDVYPAPGLPALRLTVACALFAALACVWLLRGLRRPLENPLIHAFGSVVTGAIAGVFLVRLTTDVVVVLTAHRPHTQSTAYVITAGWKNCRFGVAFEDPVLRARMTVCGTRWRLAATPQAGVLQVAELAGPYGVVLRQITTDAVGGR
ncbi:hypothetical protein C0Z18_05320 [Trinickia dabaoshanensis]|uniref:Uncharacterized protein n=1 Tax=Trinickia dabaoshanensis TaxID=564714 RepID=A0A2N7VXT3_9BURK|nr:hypothetical protein C0Z18_05320 [Trinickia dabaoshanensis]